MPARDSPNSPSSRPTSCCQLADTKNFWVVEYGLTRFRDLFTPRQLLTLCTLASGVRDVYEADALPKAWTRVALTPSRLLSRLVIDQGR